MRPGKETQLLVTRTREGDARALDDLFARHRERLVRLAERRMDPRLRSRLDPADIVQEAHLEGYRRLDAYLSDPDPMPFYRWIRYLTLQKVLELRRRHIEARSRDIRQERRAIADGGADPSGLLAALEATVTGPDRAAASAEERRILREQLDRMDPIDREILALRHARQMTNSESASELGMSASAASKRYVRALRRLRRMIGARDER